MIFRANPEIRSRAHFSDDEKFFFVFFCAQNWVSHRGNSSKSGALNCTAHEFCFWPQSFGWVRGHLSRFGLVYLGIQHLSVLCWPQKFLYKPRFLLHVNWFSISTPLSQKTDLFFVFDSVRGKPTVAGKNSIPNPGNVTCVTFRTRLIYLMMRRERALNSWSHVLHLDEQRSKLHIPSEEILMAIFFIPS